MHEGYENLPESLSSVNYSHKVNCKRYHFKFISLTCSYFHSTSFVPSQREGGKEGPDVLCLCMCLISVEFHRHLRLFFYICTLEMSKQILNIMRSSGLFLSNAARISNNDTQARTAIHKCKVCMWSPTDWFWKVSVLQDASVCFESMSEKCAAGGSVVVTGSPSSCSFLLMIDEGINK